MKWLVTGTIIIGLSACVQLPPVYLVDRHTVMELEASGEWPELEQRLHKQSLSMGPVQLSKDPIERRRERAFRVLNSEYTTANESSANDTAQ